MSDRLREILTDDLRRVHWTRLERVVILVLFGVRVKGAKR